MTLADEVSDQIKKKKPIKDKFSIFVQITCLDGGAITVRKKNFWIP
jgi:hypothetical protein